MRISEIIGYALIITFFVAGTIIVSLQWQWIISSGWRAG